MLLDAAGKRPLLPEEVEIDFAAYPSIDFTSCPFSDVLQYEVSCGTSTDPHLGLTMFAPPHVRVTWTSAILPSKNGSNMATLFFNTSTPRSTFLTQLQNASLGSFIVGIVGVAWVILVTPLVTTLGDFGISISFYFFFSLFLFFLFPFFLFELHP